MVQNTSAVQYISAAQHAMIVQYEYTILYNVEKNTSEIRPRGWHIL